MSVMEGASVERAVSPWGLRLRRFRRHRMGMASLVILAVLVLFCLAAIPLQMTGMDPDATDLFARFDPPGPGHLLGMDEAGRDVLLRLMVGGQISLLVGLLATLIGGAVGIVIGILAGYFGGRLDTALMRFTDGMIALPLLPLLIVLGALDDFCPDRATHGADGGALGKAT